MFDKLALICEGKVSAGHMYDDQSMMLIHFQVAYFGKPANVYGTVAECIVSAYLKKDLEVPNFAEHSPAG